MKKPLAIILAAVLLGGVIGYAVSRHPFTDVSDGAYYADAVQWTWEQGYDLFIATCNDSEGRDMTATFWTLIN